MTADDLGLGERRHALLERRQLLDELGREQVRAGGEDLAELREGRPELLERIAQPPRPRRVGHLVVGRGAPSSSSP